MQDREYIKYGTEFTYKGRTFTAYTTKDLIEESSRFQFLPNDILLSTYPRSGTTFTQEIIWQIKNRRNVTKGEKVSETLSRFPFLEFNHKRLSHTTKSCFDVLNSQKDEPYRLIKTHLPFEFIKENFEKVNPKMIVVMRNAKDCLISLYHHLNFVKYDWGGNFEDFFTKFLHGKTFSGSYFDNNLEWWSLRDRPNILVIFYEDLVTHLADNVLKIASFLGDELKQEEIELICYNCSFETMYGNPEINYKFGNYTFIRKGIIGDWKNHLTEQENRLLEEEIEKKFGATGLTFVYE